MAVQTDFCVDAWTVLWKPFSLNLTSSTELSYADEALLLVVFMTPSPLLRISGLLIYGAVFCFLLLKRHLLLKRKRFEQLQVQEDYLAEPRNKRPKSHDFRRRKGTVDDVLSSPRNVSQYQSPAFGSNLSFDEAVALSHPDSFHSASEQQAGRGNEDIPSQNAIRLNGNSTQRKLVKFLGNRIPGRSPKGEISDSLIEGSTDKNKHMSKKWQQYEERFYLSSLHTFILKLLFSIILVNSCLIIPPLVLESLPRLSSVEVFSVVGCLLILECMTQGFHVAIFVLFSQRSGGRQSKKIALAIGVFTVVVFLAVRFGISFSQRNLFRHTVTDFHVMNQDDELSRMSNQHALKYSLAAIEGEASQAINCTSEAMKYRTFYFGFDYFTHPLLFVFFTVCTAYRASWLSQQDGRRSLFFVAVPLIVVEALNSTAGIPGFLTALICSGQVQRFFCVEITAEIALQIAPFFFCIAVMYDSAYWRNITSNMILKKHTENIRHRLRAGDSKNPMHRKPPSRPTQKPKNSICCLWRASSSLNGSLAELPFETLEDDWQMNEGLEDILIASKDEIAINFEDVVLAGVVAVGSTARVERGIYRGRDVAVKVFTCELLVPEMLNAFIRECVLSKLFCHPHIIEVKGIVVQPPIIYLVEEYCSKGSLYDVLHSRCHLSWEARVQMAIDASKAVAFLHGLCLSGEDEEEIASENMNGGWIHADLKSLNFLVNDYNEVKLSDFGDAIRALDKVNESKGSPFWMAPEVIAEQHYSFRSDVYSLGIVIWEILTRQDPFPQYDRIEVTQAVLRGERPEVPSCIPVEFANLLRMCWKTEPVTRPTAAMIVQLLEEYSRGTRGSMGGIHREAVSSTQPIDLCVEQISDENAGSLASSAGTALTAEAYENEKRSIVLLPVDSKPHVLGMETIRFRGFANAGAEKNSDGNAEIRALRPRYSSVYLQRQERAQSCSTAERENSQQRAAVELWENKRRTSKFESSYPRRVTVSGARELDRVSVKEVELPTP